PQRGRGACRSLERARSSGGPASAPFSLPAGSRVPGHGATIASRGASSRRSIQRTVVSGEGEERGVVITLERARGRKRPPGVRSPTSTQKVAAGRPTFRYQ